MGTQGVAAGRPTLAGAPTVVVQHELVEHAAAGLLPDVLVDCIRAQLGERDGVVDGLARRLDRERDLRVADGEPAQRPQLSLPAGLAVLRYAWGPPRHKAVCRAFPAHAPLPPPSWSADP